MVDHVVRLISPVPSDAGVDRPALDHGMARMCMVSSSSQASGFLLAALLVIADAPLPTQRSAGKPHLSLLTASGGTCNHLGVCENAGILLSLPRENCLMRCVSEETLSEQGCHDFIMLVIL